MSSALLRLFVLEWKTTQITCVPSRGKLRYSLADLTLRINTNFEARATSYFQQLHGGHKSLSQRNYELD
jgi:hypothetical protein